MPPPPVAAGHGRFLLLFGNLRHQRFGGEQQRGDRRRVLQRRADDLGRVDDAGRDQVFDLVVLRVVADRAGRSPSPCATMIEPSLPALVAIQRSGSSSARRMMLTPIC